MEEARVVIVGAGPAGLVLSLALAKHGIQNVILEREREITQDPRGVYLAADAIRILYDLGLSRDMPIIGHALEYVLLHSSSFANTPYYKFDLRKDTLQQVVPAGMFHVQSALEKALRNLITKSDCCDLRTGCDVHSINESETGVYITYTAADGKAEKLHATWLIGADGKRGVVRKTFLEKIADIRQVHSDYRYEGTWVAANLHITLPTKETHPDFPAWELGMSPNEVYDLFWPKGWHFCSPPGKPTATGRFGPHEQRFWRHEFREDDWDDKMMDAEQSLWEHLTPMISRQSDDNGRPFPELAIFPRDCIEIMRCRPFRFTHKVVNKWFHRKSILIGDAAHVFPPFGGQGIVSGIRDAHQLSWRIALLENQQTASDAQVERLLSNWSAERILSIQNSVALTKMNGTLCNNDNAMFLKIVKMFAWASRSIFGEMDPQKMAEQKGLVGIKGFFSEDHGGGKRLPQIYINTLFSNQALSDSIFGSKDSPLRLLVFVQSTETPRLGLKALRRLLADSKIPSGVLSPESIAVLSREPSQPESVGFLSSSVRKVSPTPLQQLSKKQARLGYDFAAFENRLGSTTCYAIVRPDFFTYATAKDEQELDLCLRELYHKLM